VLSSLHLAFQINYHVVDFFETLCWMLVFVPCRSETES
jgi:hypothetical protein